MPRRKAMEEDEEVETIDAEEQEENEDYEEDDDSNSDLLQSCLKYLENDAVDVGWSRECEGWQIVNRIRRTLDMPTVSVTDEPDYSHFRKN